MFLIYMVLRPAPVLIIAPSSTSFLSADSTEELPRLGHESKASCFEKHQVLLSPKCHFFLPIIIYFGRKTREMGVTFYYSIY